MRTHFNYFKKVLLLLLSIASFVSCQKEPDSLGLDLQPAGDKLNVIYTDTCSVNAYTLIDDSLRTDNYNVNLLGSIVDPIFGVSTASIFTQIRLANNNVTFSAAPVLDSLVLSIPYSGLYQYASSFQELVTTPQHIKIFEVTDLMSKDSAYYADKMLAYDGYKVLADMTFTPNINDSVTVGGTKYPAMLRIKFNSYFGNKLLTASSANFIDNDHFTQFIKGLLIRTEPLNPSMVNKGSMMYLNLYSNLTNLNLYYKATSTDTTETLYSFLIDNYAARYNYFGHNGYKDASYSMKSQMGIGMPKDTTLGKQTVYLQSMGGTKVKMILPTVRNLVKNQKVAINEAVLVFKDADNNDFFSPPATITLLKKLANGSTSILPDLIEGSTFFDGAYNPYTREYKIRITRYLQQLLNSTDPDYGLIILVDNRRTTANRVMLKGTNSGGIKLEIKYNKIK